MACTICTKSFGFFNKEHGCPVCKYSFCSGCLKYKLVRDGKKLNVCLRCSKLAVTTKTPQPEADHVPPKQPITDRATSSKVSENTVPIPNDPVPEEPTGDDLIRSKLDALKVTEPDDQNPDTGAATTGDNIDIEKRLAALKGVEYKDYKNAAQRFMEVDKRTGEQKVQDLLGQYLEETKFIEVMDSKRQEQDDEITKRLNALKEHRQPGGETGGTPARTTIPDSDSDEGLTDEELARKLAQRYVEEGKMEAKLNLPDSDLDDDIPGVTTVPAGDREEELPWCTICNEDAALRCRGCGNDLYCKACYKEFHYDEDPKEHHTVAFNGKSRKG